MFTGRTHRILTLTPVVTLTAYNAKAEYMDKLGKHVDVWIDDDPATINPDGKPKASYGKWKDSGK